MKEPNIHAQAFTRSWHGYHFVEYNDGEITGLMNKATAQNYANIFGGTVRLHSQAPRSMRLADKLPFWAKVLMLASCLIFIGWAMDARGEGFKPLTRSEPIVRMVLQEAVNEPFAGLVAVAGTAFDRMADNRWPNTREEVVYQPWQYTGMRLRLRDYLPSQIEEARAAVAVAESGTRPCGTVYWYHTPDVDPAWNKKFEFKCRIGNHLFYGERE